MIPIKIQCGCGQRYSFEVEPVGGRMPATVACPVCGVDGTAAANEAIALSMPARPPAAPAAPSALPVRAASPTHAPPPPPAPSTPPPAPPRRGSTFLPGQVDRNQAVHEARAKISWGDPPEEVLKFLMIQGFSYAEAAPLVKDLFKERTSEIRVNGIRKIVVGIAMMCVPIVALFIFLSMGFFPIKTFGATILVGLYGLWTLIRGIFMVLAPKSEAGDVAEH